LAGFVNGFMGFTVEGSGFMESSQKQRQMVVYCPSYNKHHGGVGNPLYFLFQQEKRTDFNARSVT